MQEKTFRGWTLASQWAVPIVLALGAGWIQWTIANQTTSIQKTVADQATGAQFVQLAVQILSDNNADPKLRVWATSIMKRFAPEPLPDQVQTELAEGTLKFAAPSGEGSISARYLSGEEEKELEKQQVQPSQSQ